MKEKRDWPEWFSHLSLPEEQVPKPNSERKPQTADSRHVGEVSADKGQTSGD